MNDALCQPPAVDARPRAGRATGNRRKGGADGGGRQGVAKRGGRVGARPENARNRGALKTFIGPMTRHKNNKFIPPPVLLLESPHAKSARPLLQNCRREANKNTVNFLLFTAVVITGRH